MIEILGGNGIENAFLALGINAFACYRNTKSDVTIWSVTEESLDKLQKVPNRDWRDNWGWWRAARMNIRLCNTDIITIHGHPIRAWIRDDAHIEFKSLADYFDKECGLNNISEMTAMAVDLAEINAITLTSLFVYYQGDEPF